MTRPSAKDDATRDRMTRQKRSRTKPEEAVRVQLRALGVRYRLNNRSLPGSPDFSNQRQGWALFVHGCYWHHHAGCSRATVPRNNRAWWLAKFERNRTRDAKKVLDLIALGLRVFTVWECETQDSEALRERLRVWLSDV